MKNKIFLLITIFFIAGNSLYSESVIDKAKKQRVKNLYYLIFLNTPVANFGNADQKKEYEELKFQYGRALSLYFENNFLGAYRGFANILETIEEIYERTSLDYIDRTNEMLQEAISSLVEIDVKYHRSSTIIDRMLTNIEPPHEKAFYDPKEFHFTYDKRAMIGNMDNAYQLIQYAKQLRKKAIDLDKYLEEGKQISSSSRLRKVDNYQRAIELCRQAKRNALAVYQLINRHKIVESSRHEGNPYLRERKLDPVFDTRIPEKYIVDANDALNRVHSDEISLKIDLKYYDKELKKRKESANKVNNRSTPNRAVPVTPGNQTNR